MILFTISSYVFYKDPGETFDNYENVKLAFKILMLIVVCKCFMLYLIVNIFLYFFTIIKKYVESIQADCGDTKCFIYFRLIFSLHFYFVTIHLVLV